MQAEREGVSPSEAEVEAGARAIEPLMKVWMESRPVQPRGKRKLDTPRGNVWFIAQTVLQAAASARSVAPNGNTSGLAAEVNRLQAEYAILDRAHGEMRASWRLQGSELLERANAAERERDRLRAENDRLRAELGEAPADAPGPVAEAEPSEPGRVWEGDVEAKARALCTTAGEDPDEPVFPGITMPQGYTKPAGPARPWWTFKVDEARRALAAGSADGGEHGN